MRLNYQLIRDFVSQILNKDFTSPIEALVDNSLWLQTFMLAKARCPDSNPANTKKRKHLTHLEDYIFRKEGEYRQLNNTIWNPATICALLNSCFPKGAQSSDKDTLYTDVSKIQPKWCRRVGIFDVDSHSNYRLRA
jgi:hypothetical protein